jgi:pSer/pThr/pTyr-binding forkhead associated (FHA) protein
MPTLTLKFKKEPIALFSLEQGRSLTIGRRSDNEIILNNLAVSGYHAKIDSVGDGFVFIDLQSKNGSFVNEKLINSHWLQAGDVISIGKHSLEFSYTQEESQPNDQPGKMDKTMVMDTSHYRSLIEKSTPAPIPQTEAPQLAKISERQRGYLSYLSGGEGNIRLRSKLTKIGKDPTSDIVIKGFTIGKTAVTISRTEEGYVLNYVGGMTKPRVNDQKINKEAVILKKSDIIDIGATKLQFRIKKVRKKPLA